MIDDGPLQQRPTHGGKHSEALALRQSSALELASHRNQPRSFNPSLNDNGAALHTAATPKQLLQSGSGVYHQPTCFGGDKTMSENGATPMIGNPDDKTQVQVDGNICQPFRPAMTHQLLASCDGNQADPSDEQAATAACWGTIATNHDRSTQ